MAASGWMLGSSSTGFSIGADEGTRPVYFASPSDPVMTINCTSEEGTGTCQGANGVDVNGTHINVPANARPDGNWDAHMAVIETATGQEYDFWHTSVSGSTITAGTGAVSNVNTGNGVGGGGNAAGFDLSAGLLRPSELASGQINHALVITVPCTNATGANVGYSYPAEGGWGEYCGQYWNENASNAPMLGQRFQLNMTAAQIAASGAPAWQQTIMTALANYGAYIEDTNGSWHNEGMYIETQDPTSWTSLGQTNQWTAAVNALGGSGSNLTSNIPIPTSKLQLINTCVTQATCISTPTTPIASPTPPTTTPVTVTTPTPVRANPSPSASPSASTPAPGTGSGSTSPASTPATSSTSTGSGSTSPASAPASSSDASAPSTGSAEHHRGHARHHETSRRVVGRNAQVRRAHRTYDRAHKRRHRTDRPARAV